MLLILLKNKQFIFIYKQTGGPGSWGGIATELRAGRSGDRIPVRTGPGGPPNLLYNGYRVFPRGKERPGRDADLTSF